MATTRVCPVCQSIWTSQWPIGARVMCGDCADLHDKESRAAIAKVFRAVQRGDMPRAAELACVDCGSPASVYDHRDYTKPLAVEPVCRSCNARRGSAFNSFHRPDPGADSIQFQEAA